MKAEKSAWGYGSENESSKFWLSVLNDIQLCIVHMVRNSLKYVGYKERKEVAGDLKQIYPSINEEEALLALKQFETKWDGKFPSIGKSWRH